MAIEEKTADLPETFRLCFFGTLRDRDILKAIVGDAAYAQLQFQEGVIPGRAEYAEGKPYPVFLEAPLNRIYNKTWVTIVSGWTLEALQELDRYENGKYGYRLTDARAGEKPIRCLMYRAGKQVTGSGEAWTLQNFQSAHKKSWLQKTIDDKAVGGIGAPPFPVMSDLFRRHYLANGRRAPAA